jgi:hypothetical protein
VGVEVRGFEPLTSSVRESVGWWSRPATSNRVGPMSWDNTEPLVTVVVRCDPVVCGPNVAPMWPQQSRAWKARPVPSSWPDATPLP